MARLNKFSDKNRKKRKNILPASGQSRFLVNLVIPLSYALLYILLKTILAVEFNIITVIPCMLHIEVGLDASKKYFLAVIILYIVTLIFNFGI